MTIETRVRSTSTSSGGGGSELEIAIGEPVIDGTSGSVLFVDSSGNLAQDNASFSFDDSLNKLSITNVAVTGTTASTSTTTGSLINAGGFGCAGAAYIGGTANIGRTVTGSATDPFASTQFANFDTASAATAANIYGVIVGKNGATALFLGNNKNSAYGNVPTNASMMGVYGLDKGLWLGLGLQNTSNITGLYIAPTTGNVLIGGTTDVAGPGSLKVFGTTASTSKTTGALIVAGGLGVAGAIYNGAEIQSDGGIIAGSSSNFKWQGNSARIYSPGDGIIRLSNQADTPSFTRLQFGGTTNAFPALSPNGSQLEAVKADGSAFTNFAAASFQAAATGQFSFLNRSILLSTADGKLKLSNWGLTAGAILDFSTADTVKFRNYADDADAAITAAGATFSGTVNLRTGTASAGTSPIKFTAGTLLTVPEAGTIEYDGADFYLAVA